MTLDEPYRRQYRDIRNREETKINELVKALFSDLSSDQEVKDVITLKKIEAFIDLRIRMFASSLVTSQGLNYKIVVENYIPSPECAAYSSVREKAKEFLLNYT